MGKSYADWGMKFDENFIPDIEADDISDFEDDQDDGYYVVEESDSIDCDVDNYVERIVEQTNLEETISIISTNKSLEDYAYLRNTKKLTQEQLAAAIVSQLCSEYVFGIYDGELKIYNSSKGYFKPLPLKANGETSLLKLMVNLESPNLSSKSLTSSIADKVAKLLFNKNGLVTKLDKQLPNVVTLQNGVFDLNTDTLLEFSPRHRSLYKIRANLCGLPMSETSENFLWHLAGETQDGYDALMQMIGLAISNVRFTQSAGFIVGKPGCGKSVLMEFLRRIMSKGSVKTFEFSALLKNTDRSNIMGAQIAICSDLETNIIPAKAVAIFKQLTSGEPISARKLYNDAIDFLPNAFIILCGNQLPVIEDDSGAFERRLITVITGDTIPEDQRDPYLIERLWKDRDAIVSTALQYASDVYNGITPIVRMPIKLHKTAFNPNIAISQWAHTRLHDNCGGVVYAQQLYEDFCKFSDINLEYNGFCQRLQKLYPSLQKIRKNNKSMFMGVTLAEDGSDEAND